MTESGDSSGTEKDQASLDLSSLLNNDAFGPDWASGKPGAQPRQAFKENSGRPERRARPPRGGDGGDRRRGAGRVPDRRQGGRRDSRPSRPYEPEYNVQIQPNGQAYSALTKAMRDSSRTFELFEIANLFLSKPDRFTAKLFPKEGAGAELSSFHVSVPDGIGFESEDAAVAHVLANHLSKFFEVEETELEPPKGTFNVVNRCSVTGVLLGPPNYHRYQHILQEHFAARITGMSFERFSSRVETVSEQEVIDQWVESMKKGCAYKDKKSGKVFHHMEEARRHLIMEYKDRIVRAADTCRVDGKDLEKLPMGRVRRSVEAVLENLRKFPLEFANHLRGRLRRANFTIYKRGGRGGVTFVCAVRRQYRTAESNFSDAIQALLKFVEDNPDVTVQQVLATEAPLEEAAAASAKGQGGAEPEVPVQYVGEKPQSATLGQDLRWLVQYGFVTEYSDGRLFAPPIRQEKPAPQKADAKAASSTPPAEARAVEAPEASSEVGEVVTEAVDPVTETPVDQPTEPAEPDVDASSGSESPSSGVAESEPSEPEAPVSAPTEAPEA